MSVFPNEFIARVEAHYPDNSDGLHDALRNPNPANALTWLRNYATYNIPVEHVVLLLEQEMAEELLAEAQRYQTGLELFAEAYRYAEKASHA